MIPRERVYNNDPEVEVVGEAPLGTGIAACRCYRCGTLLVFETVTVDRIIPKVKGGTYARPNIRPACLDCNSETGGALAHTRVKVTQKKVSLRVTERV